MNVTATLLPEEQFSLKQRGTPGMIMYLTKYPWETDYGRYPDDPRAPVVQLHYSCPRCGEFHIEGWTADGGRWDWNGNIEKPTLTSKDTDTFGPCLCGWDGRLEDGVFIEAARTKHIPGKWYAKSEPARGKYRMVLWTNPFYFGVRLFGRFVGFGLSDPLYKTQRSRNVLLWR